MDLLAKVAETLPRVKTKLQLAGFIVLVGGVIATREVRPEALLAQISAGAIGVLFLVFGQVFGSLGQIERQERATLVLRLFLIFIVFILILVILTFLCLAHEGIARKPSSTQIPPHDPAINEAGAQLVDAMVRDRAVDRISERLTKEVAARDRIRNPIRTLYSGLLLLRERRSEFRSLLQIRITLIEREAAEQQLHQNIEDLDEAGYKIRTGLESVESAFHDIEVDLDLQNPGLTAGLVVYQRGNTTLFHSGAWDTKSADELKSLIGQLDENTLLLNSSIDDLRILVKKFFPDFGDLYSPA